MSSKINFYNKIRNVDAQFLHVVEDLSDMFDNGDLYDIIYFDFEKVFDQV